MPGKNSFSYFHLSARLSHSVFNSNVKMPLMRWLAWLCINRISDGFSVRHEQEGKIETSNNQPDQTEQHVRKVGVQTEITFEIE